MRVCMPYTNDDGEPFAAIYDVATYDDVFNTVVEDFFGGSDEEYFAEVKKELAEENVNVWDVFSKRGIYLGDWFEI